MLFLLLSILVVGWSAGPEPVVLDYEHFRASGAGATITSGRIAKDTSTLRVNSAVSWKKDHWVRVARAGVAKQVLSGQVDCSQLAPCNIATSDGNLEFDELRLRIRPSAAVAAGDLQIEFSGPDASGQIRSKLQMPLPALSSVWSETYLRLQARKGPRRRAIDFAVDRVALHCMKNCNGLTASVADLELVQDLVAKVQSITVQPIGALFQLDRPAQRTATGQKVFHDDTRAVQGWLDFEPSRPHVAPKGVYYLSRVPLGRAVLLSSNTSITGAGADRTIFKNSGGANTGLQLLFLSCAATLCGTAAYCADEPGCDATPENISIRDCGFDINGHNVADFTDAIAIAGNGARRKPARNINIRENRFFDSVYDADPAAAMENCDVSLDTCATRQRQHVVVVYAQDVNIEDNRLSGGGRIKAGGPGTNLSIQRNTLDFVNDNAITVVDGAGPDAPCVPVGVENPPASGVPCLSHDIQITDNRINNAINASIFFGADGQPSDNAGMRIENIAVQNNWIGGHFNYGIHSIIPGGGARNVLVAQNIVNMDRPNALGPDLYTRGISLARGDSGSQTPGELIQVRRNRVRVTSPNGAYSLGGMYLVGPMRDLTVKNNSILCSDCVGGAFISSGMFLVGSFDAPTILRNRVDRASVALRIDGGMTNGRIDTNTLTRSLNTSAGQISLQPPAGTTLSALIKGNTITDGQGAGIKCAPTGGVFALSLDSNVLTGNQGGAIVGCP